IAAFQQAIAHGYRGASSKYNIACSYALLGNEESAVKWLDDAIRSGWDDFDHLAKDSDFDPIRTGARFQRFVASLGDGKAHKHTRRIEKTLDRYDSLRSSASRDGDDWFSVGLDLLRLRDLDRSIDAFEQAVRVDSKTSTALYNIACAYSLKGDVARARDYLVRAVENGFDNVEKLKNDPDLRNVRAQSRIDDLVQLAEDLRLHNKWQGAKSWFWGSGSEEEAWKEMVPRFRAMTEKYPRLGRTWFNLGYAQLQSGANESAAQSFQKALQLGYRPGASTYNTACAYARAGNANAAFDWLQRAHAVGFKLRGYLEDDDDLESLHGDPRWRQLKQQVRYENSDDEDGEIY
ncbi:MAG TPA: tetratricopeptide repeat protein, partial [Thermoanaerobaculia bacterium]|nr:tetratricopeptide repeat protein [Thermoanaerobaculia bacterium]